jgi:TolA-binding protein
MKKIPYLLIFVLFTFLLAGCSDDQYALEKQYWYTKKSATKIFVNPEATPPMELSRAVSKLVNFSKRFPKTQLAVDADFTVAQLYVVKKDYPKARTYLQSMVGKYKSFPVICAESTFLLGKTYEVDEQWDRALQQYKNIMRDYPVTPRGLSVAVYIASYYRQKYQPDKMVQAYQEAITFYKELSLKYPNTPLSLKADMLTAQCYMAIQDWQAAANSLEVIIREYKGKVRVDNFMLKLASIYKKNLKDEARSKEILNQIIKEYPEGKVAKISKAVLKEMDKPKKAAPKEKK